MMATTALYLDLIVAFLLIATIIYGFQLNRKLGALRSNKAELDVLIQSFNDACMRAEAGVRTLRSATDEAQRLQQYLARGQMLRDDLSFLNERGTVLADRLEGNVRTARTEAQSRPAGEAPSRGTPIGGLRAAAQAPAPMPAAPPPIQVAIQAEPEPQRRIVADLSAISPEVGAPRAPRAQRERATLRGEPRADQAPAAAAGGPAPRSRAEKELLEALRAKR